MFPSRRNERDPLWRREMRERWRRPITLFFVTLYVTGLCWFAYSLYSTLVPIGEVELTGQLRGVGRSLFIAVLKLQIGFWIVFSLLLAAPTVAAEKERHALTEYLLAGLTSRQIIRAKFASIATFVTVMCAVPLPVLALCFPLGGVEPMELVAGVALEIAVALFCATMGLFISVSSKRVTGAMQSAMATGLFFLLVGIPLLLALLEVPFPTWILFAAFLVMGAFALLVGSEESLIAISRHLEQEETTLRPPPAPTFAPPPPRPINQSASLGAYAPAPVQTARTEPLRASAWDNCIEGIAAFSAVAQREVRVGLRSSRMNTLLSPEKPEYHWLWVLLGVGGAVLVSLSATPMLWYLFLGPATFLALMSTVSSASAGFTREREQKMLAQLQMCPLSPLEIVSGKMGAALLLMTRGWSGPLLCLFVMGFWAGPVVAVEVALFVSLSLVFAAALGTLFSLLCHHTAIATGGTTGTIVALFVLLPLGAESLVYFAPQLGVVLNSFPFGPMWLEPIQLVRQSNSDLPPALSPSEALFRLVCSLLVAIAVLIFASVGIWARTSPDEAQAKERFWERDISRSWR